MKREDIRVGMRVQLTRDFDEFKKGHPGTVSQFDVTKLDFIRVVLDGDDYSFNSGRTRRIGRPLYDDEIEPINPLSQLAIPGAYTLNLTNPVSTL